LIGTLTLDQLRVLVAIADSGSFSAAGRNLQRVQSAISQTIRTLEDVQGVQLFDRSAHKPQLTPAGRVLVEQARQVLSSANRFEAMAGASRAGLEAELTLTIDPMVPTEPLFHSLQALSRTFPHLAVNFWTEAVGGSQRRLQDGSASLGVCLLLPSVPADLVAYSVMEMQLVPVVAATHPLASMGRQLDRSELEPHVQLVLSDPHSKDTASFGVVGPRLWRFVDLGRRLDFLLAGFGWCKMPLHLVKEHLADGRLIKLDIADESVSRPGALPIYVAHARNRPLGRAGDWLMNDLRVRLGATS
jgi:DNA-binding transcriptional LysR family regulator